MAFGKREEEEKGRREGGERERERDSQRRLALSHIFIKGVVTGRAGGYLVRGGWQGRATGRRQ